MPLRPPASSSCPRAYHSAPGLAGPSRGPDRGGGSAIPGPGPRPLFNRNQQDDIEARPLGRMRSKGSTRSHFRDLSRAASIASMWS